MIRLLQSNWIASLLGLASYLLVTFLLWRPHVEQPIAQEEETKVRTPVPSWAFHSPEVDLLITELKQEKEAFAAKERELKELANRLQAERAELGQITQAVQQLQADFDLNVTRVREEEISNLKKLAKTYAAMTPEGAAAIFKALDDSTVVKVMMFMKESETAPILELMAKQSDSQAKRVAGLSERIRLAVNGAKKPPGA